MTLFGRQTQKKAKIAWAECCDLTRLTEAALRVRGWLRGSVPVAILTYHRILPEDQCRFVYSTSIAEQSGTHAFKMRHHHL